MPQGNGEDEILDKQFLAPFLLWHFLLFVQTECYGAAIFGLLHFRLVVRV